MAGLCFGALREINVEMISMGASEINLSFVVKQEDAKPALRALHAVLVESPALDTKRVLNEFPELEVSRSA